MMVQDERNFTLSVAGHSFAIHTLYTDTYSLCRDYICEGPGEKEINITVKDIEIEQKEAINQGTNLRCAYLETLAVYRKIAETMLDDDTFLMHGAVVGINNHAYMFTAASGTGKTTHVKKWIKKLKNSYVVNGDKPLIKLTDNEVIACGTPWCGKERWGKNCMVPLRAIVLMERGENNTINEITFGQALTGLLQQTYVFSDFDKKKKVLMLLSRMNGKIKFYKFSCNNMKEDSFSVAYKALTEGEK